jgi:hypothetical protein
MLWLGGILQRMSMLENTRYAACAGTENRRIGIAQIGIETCLTKPPGQLLWIGITMKTGDIRNLVALSKAEADSQS